MLRDVIPKDMPTLIEHRSLMFEEMYIAEGKCCVEKGFEIMEATYRDFLETHFFDGTLFGWVVDINDLCVCSGVLSIIIWPPAVGDVTERAGLFHGLYTLPQFRRLGYARQIVEKVISFAKKESLKWIALGPSHAGRKLYESLGFQDVDHMRLKMK
jgi:GNAT superfamily N-acetyltransferase